MPFFARIPFVFVLFLGGSISQVQATELADEEDIVVGLVEEKLPLGDVPAADTGALETSVEEAAQEALPVPLQLLGEEVKLGRFMSLNWSPEQSFQSLNTPVIGIPIVNLDGFRRGSRYLADRRDLNRHFPGSPKGSAADRKSNRAGVRAYHKELS
jgi:hypothetical protein